MQREYQVRHRFDHNEFFQWIELADVIIDPLHLVGGTTTYDSLWSGTPIVTLPSPFLRGRITFACYQQIGFHDCIATSSYDYVSKALQLGTNNDYRNEIKNKLKLSATQLYQNPVGIRELEQWLKASLLF